MIPETALLVTWISELMQTIAPGVRVCDELPDRDSDLGEDGLTDYQRGIMQVERVPTASSPVPGLRTPIAEVRLYLASPGRGERADWDRAESIVQLLCGAVTASGRRFGPIPVSVGGETATLHAPVVVTEPSRTVDIGNYAVVVSRFQVPWRMTN